MSLGQLVVELSLDGSEFTLNLKRADGQLAQLIQRSGQADQAARRAERSTRSWGHALRDSVIVLSLIRSAIQNVSDAAFGWQRAIVSVNAEMERSIQLMKNFSKETNSTKATVEAINDVQGLLDRAATSPFSLNSITNSFVKLRVAGLDPANKSLNTLIDSVAAFGGTDQNLERAAVAIQQMAGKGVVSMEELRQQLGESVPTAINAMADALGTSYSDLVKQISLGRVKSEPALAAMMDELKLRFEGSAAAMMNTWNGAVAQFETTIKRMALAIGGLSESGYEENGYFKTLTTELKNLNQIMSTPEMMESAREFGRALAEIVKAAASGVRWIIEYKDAIYEWGKAFLYVYGAIKTLSIAQGIATGVAGAMVNLSTSMGGVLTRSTQVGGGLRTLAASMIGIVNPAVLGGQALSRKAHAVNGAKTAVYGLIAAVGALGGPIGLAAAAVAAGAYAYYEYEKGAEEAVKAVRNLKGELKSYGQLRILLDERQRQGDKFREDFSMTEQQARAEMDAEEAEEYIKRRRAAEAEYTQLQKEIFLGRATTAEVYGNLEYQKQIQALDENTKKYSNAYKLNMQSLREQFEAEAKSTGKKFDQTAFNAAADQLREISLNDQIEAFEHAQLAAQQAVAVLTAEKDAKGNMFSQEGRQKLVAATQMVTEMASRINDAKEQIDNLGSRSLANSMVESGGAGNDLKNKFNPLLKFYNSLSLGVAKAGAKAAEANPYLAQLEQTLENMAEQGQKIDPSMVAKAREAAAARWEQEKSTTALKEATDSYQNSLDRVNQIEKVLNGKELKNENENQWLKASADAQRYRDEIAGIQEELNKAQSVAKEQGDAELSGKIDEARKVISELDEKIDRVAISGATKAMNARTKEIEDSMKTQSQLIDSEYEYQMQQAREYYAELSTAQDVSAEDWAAYYNYITALRARHERDTESGLQKWIRENEDATEKYKSLWGSAMDSFVDTVADGLVEGKFEISDFVQYVLKELIKIQMAKMVAGIATSITGMFAGGAQNVGSAAAASGYSTTGYAGAYGFANGGIMTQWGKAKLKQYANGGIAREPQVAVFGEGSMAEAYVPLPDGRTIPVTLQGQMTGGQEQAQAAQPKVSVNVINQSGTQMNAEQQSAGFNGEQFVVDVVLKAVNRPGPLRDAVKGA